MARTKQGKVIGFKVESHRDEDDPSKLAVKLAGRLQEEANARADARSYRDQANRERQKAKDFSNIIVMLTEYNRKKTKALKSGEDWNPSRMEPMETYDEDMLKEERLLMINRAREFDNNADNYDKIAKEAKHEAAELQRKLVEVSKK